MTAPAPKDEAARLRALEAYQVLDTLPEAVFDEITSLAAHLCGVPISLISLVDQRRQWFKSRFGLSVHETSREISFCAHTILQREMMVVEDATKDARFADNPLVTGEPHIRFYAGVPLLTPENHALGTLCVIDRSPRRLSESQQQALGLLSRHVMTHLELRRSASRLAESNAALRASEERYARALRGTADGLWDWNLQTGEDYLSPRWKELLGFEDHELPNVATSFFDRLHPDDVARAQEAVRRHLEANVPFNLEIRLKTKGGEYRWFRTRGQAVRDAAGKAIRMAGAITDISERKQAEQNLRRSESRKSAILESALDAIIMMNHEGRITEFNPAAEQMFGHTRANALGRQMAELIIPPAFRDAHCEGLKRCLAGGEARVLGRRIELSALRGDGGEFPVELTITRIGSNEAPEFAGFLRDITERNQAKESLRDAAEFNRQIIVGAREGIAVFGRDLRYQVFNPFMEEVTSWRAESVLGRTLEEVMPGPVAVEITGRLKRALSGEIVLSGDTFIPATSVGPARWITSKSSPLRNARGEVIGVIVVLNDITERKRAEEEVRLLNFNLERRVAERTAELQETIKDLESFSYSISHDLRAPLRHIGGFSQILLESIGNKLDVTARKHLEIVAGSARLMGQLVDDLLKFARLGRQHLSLATVDLDAMARAVLAEQQQLEPGRPVTALCGALPCATGDTALLRQVLVNLVSNAFKYSRHQRQAIVEIGARTAPGETIYFVKDNGAGFDMRYADKLFGVFQRLHRHDEFEGTGVGLAIVQRIVHRHCGRVWAEAKEGGGATFYFALPTESAAPSDSLIPPHDGRE